MIQLHLQETEEKQSNQGLESKFKELKNTKVEKATTRVVNFYVKLGCGCGIGHYEKYHAEVPIDNSIEDGDYIGSFRDDMSNIEKGWV